MINLICLFFGHKWITLKKIKMSDIVKSLQEKFEFIDKRYYVKVDSFIYDKKCLRCPKTDYNIRPMIKFLKNKLRK